MNTELQYGRLRSFSLRVGGQVLSQWQARTTRQNRSCSIFWLTCPVAIVGSHYPVAFYSALVANVATYALAGPVVETVRRQLNHSD
jgi:hypothetical protein